MSRLFALLFCTIALHSITPLTQAGPLGVSGDSLLVVRVGNGINLLSANAAAVSILEINRATGALIQTIDLPTSGASAFTLAGNDRTEGTLSAVGSTAGGNALFTLAGYNANALSANVASGTSTRLAGRLDLSGTFASFGMGTAFSGISVKGAATTTAGNVFWVTGNSGNNGGLQYRNAVGTVTNIGSSDTPNPNQLRQVQVHDTNLFVAGAGATPGRAIFDVGGGLPTGGSPTFTNANTINLGGKEYNSFFFTRVGTGTTWTPPGSADTGYDTLYAVNSNAGTVEKWNFNGTSWEAKGTIVASSGAFINVTGVTIGSNVNLYLTTSEAVWRGTDTTGFGSSFTGTSFSTLVTAGTNYAFRGIAIVPEPGSLALCGFAVAGFAGYFARRRKSNILPQ